MTGLQTALTVAAGVAVWTLRLRGLAHLRAQPPAPTAPSAWPAVSIVIPARNEAANLPALLSSLARLDPAPAEIIVVDDHSTDGTAAVARQAGARVLRPGPRPRDWLGKPWACAAGAAQARGDWILFTDADTVHGPAALATAVGRAAETGAGLVSVLPSHVAVARWERFQGIFHLLLAIATRTTDGLSGRTGGERRFCIGQFLLFSRRAYDAVGGHAAVRDRVAEDLAFAARVTRAGLGYQLVGAPGLLRVRMYPGGVRDFVAGWRRNFREGLRSAGLLGVAEISAVLGWLLGVPLAAAAALATGHPGQALAWGAVYAATSLEVHRRQALVMASAPPAAVAFGYPVFALLFALISTLALADRLLGRPVSWKGRSIPVQRLE